MINGIGNGMSQQNMDHVHHVTECIHKETAKALEGGAAMRSTSVPQKEVQTVVTQQPAWNLFQWMGKTWNHGVSLFRGLFGIRPANSVNESSQSPDIPQPLGTEKSAHKTAGYFAPVQEDTTPNTWYHRFRERTRIKFGTIRNSLAKYLKQDQNLSMGTGRNGQSSGKEKQDRSRLSVYREDEQEIECIITDDSYLLDSYNRKGDYSKLGK